MLHLLTKQGILIAFCRLTYNYIKGKYNYFSIKAEIFHLKFNSSIIYSNMNLKLNQEIDFYKSYFRGKKNRGEVIINAKRSLYFIRPNISS